MLVTNFGSQHGHQSSSLTQELESSPTFWYIVPSAILIHTSSVTEQSENPVIYMFDNYLLDFCLPSKHYMLCWPLCSSIKQSIRFVVTVYKQREHIMNKNNVYDCSSLIKQHYQTEPQLF